MKKYLLLAILVISTVKLYSQNQLTIHIRDNQRNPLPYPEIQIPNKIHKIGNQKGELVIDKDTLSMGDSICVRYMGFETGYTLIDTSLLANDKIHVTLVEKSFFLDPVIVHKNNFDSESFFKKKKRFLLIPFFRDYSFEVDFDFTIKNQSYQQGKALCKFNNPYVEVDSIIPTLSDSISHKNLIRCLKRSSEINYLMAYIFCHSKNRKQFYCDYKGVEEQLHVWELTKRPEKNMPWDLHEKDMLTCRVYINEEGIISHIATQLTSFDESKNSYLLQTDYTLYKRQLVPSSTIFKELSNAQNDKPEIVIEMKYSNIQTK